MSAGHTAGWLIEEGVGPMGIHWIGLSTGAWPLLKVRRIVRDGDEIEQYQTPIRRVKDAGDALRFSRREDAEAFANLFSRFLLHPRITEHQWPAIEAAEADLLGRCLEVLRARIEALRSGTIEDEARVDERIRDILSQAREVK